MPALPETAALWDAKREPAIEYVDRNGKTIAIRGPRYGRAIKIDELPPHVPRAFIAAEDKRFYEHDGADTQAMARAAISNVISRRTVSGASTITQQLVKNLVLSPEQTLKRKVQEVRLARELEEKLSKNEILELYLNRVYFGSGFYGLGAASRFYFGKDPQDLTLAEASLLATLPKAPSRLALDDNMEGAKQRQAYVLSEMLQAGFITAESAQIAMNADVALAPEPEQDPQFGFILDAATERAKRHDPGSSGRYGDHADHRLRAAIESVRSSRSADERRIGRGQSRANGSDRDEPRWPRARPVRWTRLHGKPVQSRNASQAAAWLGV